MIKINLALRKQAAGAQSSDAGDKAAGGGGGLGGIKISKVAIDLDQLRELPLRQIAIVVAVYVVGGYVLEDYKAGEIAKVDATIAGLSAEKSKLTAEAAKMKGYEDLKKSLESDEKIMRTKIETIQKLIADRQSPPKVLISIAEAIPKDVWLQDFKIAKGEVTMKGYSLGFNQISDFMKSLNENVYFTDVGLKNTQQAKDEAGVEVANFELSAKRKEPQ